MRTPERRSQEVTRRLKQSFDFFQPRDDAVPTRNASRTKCWSRAVMKSRVAQNYATVGSELSLSSVELDLNQNRKLI